MPVDVPTVMVSAGLSAVVAVVTAGSVARVKARAERDLDARAAIRAAAQPLRQEHALWWRQGMTEREPETPSTADAAAITAVLAVLPDLSWGRRALVRRRLRRLFGETWLHFLELFPYDPDDPDTTIKRAVAYEHRVAGSFGEGGLLTGGLVHRTLSMQVFGGKPGERLDRELRALYAVR